MINPLSVEYNLKILNLKHDQWPIAVLVFLFSCCLAFPAFGQINLDQVEYSQATKNGANSQTTKSIKRGRPAQGPEKESLEGDPKSPKEDDLSDLEQTQLERQQALKAASDPKALIERLKSDPDLLKNLEKNPMFKQAMDQMNRMPEQEIEQMLINTPSPFSKIIFKNFPKLATFIAKVMKDRKAKEGIAQMLQQKEKRKTYGLSVLFLFVAVFLISKFSKKPEMSFFKRFFRKIFFSFLFFALNLGALFWFYGKELTPTVKIAQKVFL